MEELTLKYYFYYSEDKGFNGHWNSLESAMVDVYFTPTKKNGEEITDPVAAASGTGY